MISTLTAKVIVARCRLKFFVIDLVSVNGDLEMTGQFEWMDLDTDENEHSIEMHLPYIAKVMEK